MWSWPMTSIVMSSVMNRTGAGVGTVGGGTEDDGTVERAKLLNLPSMTQRRHGRCSQAYAGAGALQTME